MIALPDFKQLFKFVGFVIIVTWFLFVNLTN